MNPLTELIEAKTITEVKAVRRKYMDILPKNQRWKFENLIMHRSIFIRQQELNKSVN
jgi:hypothetical protein